MRVFDSFSLRKERLLLITVLLNLMLLACSMLKLLLNVWNHDYANFYFCCSLG